jgi:hypothetical protein
MMHPEIQKRGVPTTVRRIRLHGLQQHQMEEASDAHSSSSCNNSRCSHGAHLMRGRSAESTAAGGGEAASGVAAASDPSG